MPLLTCASEEHGSLQAVENAPASFPGRRGKTTFFNRSDGSLTIGLAEPLAVDARDSHPLEVVWPHSLRICNLCRARRSE